MVGKPVAGVFFSSYAATTSKTATLTIFSCVLATTANSLGFSIPAFFQRKSNAITLNKILILRGKEINFCLQCSYCLNSTWIRA